MSEKPIPKAEREQTHWYECKVWKMMKQSGASLNNQWGLDRALELRWCTAPSGKSHLCSWNDREHEVVRKYEADRKAGKAHGNAYDTPDSFFKHLKHDCDKEGCKPYKIDTDEYGNESRYFK